MRSLSDHRTRLTSVFFVTHLTVSEREKDTANCSHTGKHPFSIVVRYDHLVPLFMRFSWESNSILTRIHLESNWNPIELHFLSYGPIGILFIEIFYKFCCLLHLIKTNEILLSCLNYISFEANIQRLMNFKLCTYINLLGMCMGCVCVCGWLASTNKNRQSTWVSINQCMCVCVHANAFTIH